MNGKVKTIAIGEAKIVWKCFYCGKENCSDLDEENEEVTCKWCGQTMELWMNGDKS